MNSFSVALDQVTPESATATMSDLLPTDRLSLVVVGDADALHDPLVEAGWDVARRR